MTKSPGRSFQLPYAKIILSVLALIMLVLTPALIHAELSNRSPKSQMSTSGNSGNGTVPVANGSTGTTDPEHQTPPCTSYTAIDSQTWLEIVKDPDSYIGLCYTVYGEVTQFDAATGTGGFRADIGGVQQTPQYGFVDYPTNTALVGDPNTLKDVVEKDLFTANVMVLSSYTYDTQIGGQTTVPQLQVGSITVTGSVQ